MLSGLPLIADIELWHFRDAAKRGRHAVARRCRAKCHEGAKVEYFPRASGGAPEVFETPQDKASLLGLRFSNREF
jgi:hypothetical protein